MENSVKKLQSLSLEEKRQFMRNFITICQVYEIPKPFMNILWQGCKYIESEVLSKLPNHGG